MKLINIRTGRIADLRDPSAEDLLDAWDPYDPEELSIEDLLLIYLEISISVSSNRHLPLKKWDTFRNYWKY